MHKIYKLLIIILSIIILIAIIYIIKTVKQKKNICKLINDNSNNKYKVYKAKRKLYDYALRFDDFDIYLKYDIVPKYSQVCINAKETWRLNYNSFKTELGGAYQNNRYMTELESFLKNDIKTNRRYIKVILLYKEVEGIVRYLNETELDCIDINKTPYGYKIVTFNTFIKDLDVIIDYMKKNL